MRFRGIAPVAIGGDGNILGLPVVEQQPAHFLELDHVDLAAGEPLIQDVKRGTASGEARGTVALISPRHVHQPDEQLHDPQEDCHNPHCGEQRQDRTYYHASTLGAA